MSPEQKLELVLSRLTHVKKVRSGFMARCPAHEDKSPSLSIALGENIVLLHCWAGCNINAVREAIGLTWDDLYYDGRQVQTEPRKKPAFTAEKRRALALEAKACALRLQGDTETLKRLRRERGWARQALANLEVGWTGKKLTLLSQDKTGQPHDILLYDPFLKRGGRKMIAGEGRSRQPWPPPEIVKPRGTLPLYIVEGEGTAISIASLGLPVVALPGSISKPTYDPTNPGSWRGVGWHPSWIYRFTGSKFVLIPDCDQVGRQLMLAVNYDLERAGSTCTFLDLSPSNFSGFDIGDWLRPAVTLELRQEAKWLLETAVKTVAKAPEQAEQARELMRDWYRELQVQV